MQVQLHPTHLPLLLHLGDCLAVARAVEAAAAPPAGALDRGGAPDQAPASRSFIEGVFVPDTTAFATEFIARSWGYGEAGGGGGKALNPDAAEGAPGGASVFVDAHSVLGSFRSGFSSFAAATAASLRESVPRPLAAWGGPGSGAEAAAVEEGGEGGGWQLRVQTQDLSLVLWYPDAPDVPGLQARPFIRACRSNLTLQSCKKLLVWALLRVRAAGRGRCRPVIVMHAFTQKV